MGLKSLESAQCLHFIAEEFNTITLMPSDKKSPLLLVEDEEDDIVIIREAFRKVDPAVPVEVVRGGEDAMRYMAGEGPFADRDRFPLPFLILLDLKMPGWNGFEFMDWLKYQPGLQDTPIVVLTSSGMDDDVRKSFACGAKSYLIKPSDFSDLQELMRLVNLYWPVIKDTVVVRREETR